MRPAWIVPNLAASGAGPLVTFAILAVVIPIQLTYWAPEVFREWVLFSAISIFFLFADGGLSTTGGIETAIQASAGNYSRAQKTFNSFSAICGLMIAVVAALVTIAFQADIVLASLRITSMTKLEVSGTLVAFAVYAIGMSQSGLVECAYRSQGKFHIYHWLNNASRLFEGVLMIAVITLGGGILLAAATMALSRTLALMLIFRYAQRISPWLNCKFRIDWEIQTHLKKATLGSVGITVGNALYLGGFTIAISMSTNEIFVATFTTLRTIARTIPLAITSISTAISPEITRSLGKGDLARTRRLTFKSGLWTIGLSLFLSILLYWFGELVFLTWTRHKLPFDQTTFLFLVVAAFSNSMWIPKLSALTSTNLHGKIGIWFAILSFLACVAASIFPRYLPEYTVPIILVMFDLCILCMLASSYGDFKQVQK